MVAVNDASDDATVALPQQYRQCDPWRLHKPASGPGNALNHGPAQARGEFIARMDGVPLQPPQWLLEHSVRPVVLVCIVRHGPTAWLQQHDLRPGRDYYQSG